MANISLVTYAGQTVTPLDDALVYETAINKSGMIYGGVVTIKNANNLHISGGHGMVCGRKFTIFDSDIQVALSSSGTLLGRLYVQLDLSNIGTPIQLLVETGASLTPVQQDQNVNIQNGVYEFNLATFSVDTSTISNLVNVAPSAEPSTGAGSIITVTTAEASLKGKMCTLTDGVNTLNANFDNTGTVVFYGVQMVGTVIVNATDGTYYASSQITITYFGKYSTALAFWGATVNLTTSTADFYGQTIEVTQDGIAVGSTAFDGAGSATYIAPAAGTYVFTVTYGGNDYSATVVVTEETTYTAVINNGFVLADWLSAGGVTGTYADLAAVLADEEAVRKLMTIHAAVDYLASFEATDASVVTILNDNYAAKWISLTDYAMDVLEAAYGTLMGTIGKYGYGEWGITDATTTPPTWGALGNVPVMTSNTAPYGTASAYQVFDGNPSTTASGTDFSYTFTNPVCVKDFVVKDASGNAITGGTLQACNDGSTWGTPTDGEYYLGYRVHFASSVTVGTVQFYGRTLKVSVPKMSGNTTPYGEAFASSIVSPYNPWNMFDGVEHAENINTYKAWHGSSQTNEWCAFDFKKPVVVKMMAILPGYQYGLSNDVKRVKSYKYQASNDGNVWEDLTDILVTNQSTRNEWYYTLLNNNNDAYRYYRVFVFDNWSSDGYGIAISEAKIFGKDYSEREWDTTHPRRYLYDHGVELETIATSGHDSAYGNGYTTRYPHFKADGAEIGENVAKVFYPFVTDAKVDVTDYDTLAVVYEPFNSYGSTTDSQCGRVGATASKNPSDGYYLGTSYTTLVRAKTDPYTIADFSSLNGEYYIGVVTDENGRMDTIKELWLE